MLANFECDLHGHTSRSDGNDSPAEYIANAAKRGLKVVAITDHDVVPPKTVITENGKQDICEYAKSLGVTLLRGIEISCETYIDDTHLVCFGCDWKAPFSGSWMFLRSKARWTATAVLWKPLAVMGWR